MRRPIFLPEDHPWTKREADVVRALYRFLNYGALDAVAGFLAYLVGDRWDELTPLVRARMQ
jgi:hypothetical protein